MLNFSNDVRELLSLQDELTRTQSKGLSSFSDLHVRYSSSHQSLTLLFCVDHNLRPKLLASHGLAITTLVTSLYCKNTRIESLGTFRNVFGPFVVFRTFNDDVSSQQPYLGARFYCSPSNGLNNGYVLIFEWWGDADRSSVSRHARDVKFFIFSLTSTCRGKYDLVTNLPRHSVL